MKKVLHNTIRTYNLLLAILPTLAFYRATVQPEYKWGLLAIRGQGTAGDYWAMVGFMILAWLSFSLHRWYKKKWYFALPVVLFGTVAATLLFGYLNNISMVLQGDVYRFKFDIGFIIVALATLLFFASVLWMRHELHDFKPTIFKSGRSQNLMLLGCVALSEIVLVLFAQGRGGVHTATDGIAVALTVVQGLFFSYVNEKTYQVQMKD